MNIEETDIPDQVIDKNSYLEYLKLSKMDMIQYPNRLLETTDIHTTVDPFCNNRKIDKDIEHLSFEERDTLFKKVKASRIIQNKMLVLRAKAFGKKIATFDNKALDKEASQLMLDERSSEILEYYSRYIDDKDILKIIHTDWGYNISSSQLTEFKQSNKKKITTLQEQFRKTLNGSKLYHKRFRLEELWFLYNDRKTHYQTTKSREDVKLMMTLLNQARTEVDAHQIHIKGEITHKHEETVGEHIEREIMADLTIQDIIIARVSHRLKVNPAYLMHRLRNSIYAKFTGFKGPDDSLLEDEIIYPSSMVYNWQDIKRLNAEGSKKEFASFEEIPLKEKKEISSLKEQLKARMQEKTEKLSKIKERVEKNTGE